MGNKNIPSSVVQESADSLLEETCISHVLSIIRKDCIFDKITH